MLGGAVSRSARSLDLRTRAPEALKSVPRRRDVIYTRYLRRLDPLLQPSVSCSASEGEKAPSPPGLFTWFRKLVISPEKIVYSSSLDGVDYQELSELWLSCLGDRCYANAKNCETAMKNSFTVHLAFLESETGDPEHPVNRKLLGASRTISDGYFAAQLVDVSVLEQYRLMGIGSKLVRTIGERTRKMGPQSLAVFAGPDHRLFFWKCGYRWDFRYKIMRHINNRTHPHRSTKDTFRLDDPLVQPSTPDSRQEASDTDIEGIFR